MSEPYISKPHNTQTKYPPEVVKKWSDALQAKTLTRQQIRERWGAPLSVISAKVTEYRNCNNMKGKSA